jgi:methylenetetrahydrofolate dehydrogenase (NADP+)/methenyltetrahydrofolate cyclohydrolase
MELLHRSNVKIGGKMLSCSGVATMSKPQALLLMHANATVTICHSKTRNLSESRVKPTLSSRQSEGPLW